MSKTDFYDDDLAKHHSASRKTRGEHEAPEAGGSEAPARPVSDLNLTRMAKQKEQVEDHMAQAAQELERLRQRQENLEKEKSALEELRRRQAEYERGKREIMERLNHSIISLEKEELNAENLLELVRDTRLRCRSWVNDIDAIDEENWPEEQFREELSKGMTRIEDVRLEYNKALSKIEAMHTSDRQAGASMPLRAPEERTVEPVPEKGFAYWLKIGFAASLPLIMTLLILWLLYYMHQSGLFI